MQTSHLGLNPDAQMPSDVPACAGDVVFMSSYALGRSADIWEDPEEFRPVRFCSDKPRNMSGRPVDKVLSSCALHACDRGWHAARVAIS